MTKLEQFTKLVDSHDLTYAYSDDGSVWRRGCMQEDAIRALAKELPREDVERVWNSMVDRFLIPDARAPFYWRWPVEQCTEMPKASARP